MGFAKLSSCVLVGCLIASPAQLQAQTQRSLVQSPIPFTYSRGRNIAVTERARPEIQPIGIDLGGFQLRPKVETGVGVSDNVYRATTPKISDGYATIAPSALLMSQWVRHSLILSGGAKWDRYFNQGVRDEDSWNAGARGRIDVGAESSVVLDATTARMNESSFSGAILAGLASPIPYQRTFFSARGNYVNDRTRAVFVVDDTDLSFKSVSLIAGAQISQRNRNRNVVRATGQVEYGISPDTALFVQGGYAKTNYDADLSSGVANRDSQDLRVLGGVTFDVTALMRGSIGAGYLKRNYSSPIYTDINGLSFEGMLEYFPSELTTIAITGRRLIEDANIAGSSGYYNSGGSIRVDHELLRNFLLRAIADYEVDSYRGVNGKGKVFRISGGGRYYVNRNVSLNVDISYGDRSTSGFTNGLDFSESKGLLSVIVEL